MKSFRSIRSIRTAPARALPVAAALLGAVTVVTRVGAFVPGTGANGALANLRLYVSSASPAKHQADEWSKSRPNDAALMRYIAEQPIATWLGSWVSDIRGTVDRIVDDAAKNATVPVFVAYNIPNRDCGSYSAGGASGADRYAQWIHGIADGLAGRSAIVVLEPDAVAQSDCLSATAKADRFSMLRNAVDALKRGGAHVYLDGGNAHWVAAPVMAERLRQAGIDHADGFSLNVSNFFSTSDNVGFGNELSRMLGGKHYVIDTSRNGVGGTSDHQWCNAAGQALGTPPTTRTGNPLADAFLWIKQPGESDGTCNGGPKAGQWWADYALGLAQRASRGA